MTVSQTKKRGAILLGALLLASVAVAILVTPVAWGAVLGLAITMWVFIASPTLIVLVGRGRYSVAEAAVLPFVGLLMLLISHGATVDGAALITRTKNRLVPKPDHTEHVRPDLHAFGE